MIKVAGMWEFGWSTPITEYDLWNFPLRDFAVDEWYMSPVTGIAKNNLSELANIKESIELNPDLVPVYIDEKGETELQDFEHPENVLYILGRAASSPYTSNGSTGLSIRIQTPAMGGMLWPHQCIAMVLYDRMQKSGK